MENENNEPEHDGLPDCCKPVKEKKHKGLLAGIAYGLIPHIGCIVFIIGSILGVTVLTQFFKPLLMNRYFFHFLILLSLGFATLSSLMYLRKNGYVSFAGVKKKWKYLTTMYGTTIGVNLVLFMLIFPLLANVAVASNSITGAAVGTQDALTSITLKVDIPCPGHAPLISNELKTLGVSTINFKFPNIFEVGYNSDAISKQQILGLNVFKTYAATVVDEGSYVPASTTKSAVSTLSKNTQIVKLSVSGGNYVLVPSTLKKDVPVRLEADLSKMQGCSRAVVISAFNVNKYLTAEDSVIEFTPDKAGTFNIACSMNMYRGTFTVLESDGVKSSYVQPSSGSASSCGSGCGCGGAR